MKITMYELLGMVKDEPDRSIYVKYFDRLNKKEDVMWACKENLIYKLDQLIIELNDEVEIIEDNKEIAGKKHAENNVNFETLINELRYYRKHPQNEIEEEKEIPEKLDYKYKNMYGNMSQHKQSEIDIIDTLNSLIDYLKSKGE